jgi:hypothetical protein
MVRSCERVGWSGGKLDLVWTFLWYIDDSVWFLKALLSCSRSFFVVIFGAPSWWISWSVFKTFSWGFGGGCMCEPFVVLFSLIPLPNPWVKELDFGVFGVLGLEEFLAGFLRFLLIWQVFGGHKLGYGLPMRCSYYPQSLAQIRGAIREIGSWISGCWPAGAVHSEKPRPHQSD